MSTPTLRSVFARLSLTSPVSSSAPRASAISILPVISSLTTTVTTTTAFSPSTRWRQTRPFHITTAHAKSAAPARGSNKRTKKGKGADAPDPRIVNLKSSMPRAIPAPLRFARNRALRHWTIHRAWLLYQRKERVRREQELERMYQSMHNAMEELRKTSGPGTRDEGFLYRVALEKHGLYGHDGVPIEYARPQTETPAREPWNHDWTP
ncbi:hypothetical protein F5Y19DRAFT_83920 [Xylariaceae sp. FL1651]|nr:hypothetical protein F5Y19DRAFT_83920 [Xylariaceae sp. FL1651]